MISRVHSLNLHGLNCSPVEIEVDVSPGLPTLIIVGLPDAAVYEARDRVRSAIKESGFPFPRTRVTVNLAPAHTKKAGTLFDFPIALGVLHAVGVFPKIPEGFIVGELALDGRLRAVRGALVLAHAAAHTYQKRLYLPALNAAETRLIQSSEMIPVESLQQFVTQLQSGQPAITNRFVTRTPAIVDEAIDRVKNEYPNITEIIGQHVAKRALEIAAAGAHNLLMIGPPGVGKSMLAQSIVSLLPRLTQEDTIESTMIHSLIHTAPAPIIDAPPFRNPHHTASAAAILGGGSSMRPGELSLAHRGVLFLDELPEFRRDVLEALREPMESGAVTINRAHGSVTYPARCLFIAALNPCPCGYAGVAGRYCECSTPQLQQYARKLSGPLLDRIDLKVRVSLLSADDLKQIQVATTQVRDVTQAAPLRVATLQQICDRIASARAMQYTRQQKTNAELNADEMRRMIRVPNEARMLLEQAHAQHLLSMRGRSKTLKVARTIADLAGMKDVITQHIAEALRFTQDAASPTALRATSSVAHPT